MRVHVDTLTDRVQRLKDARSEAEKEIEEYKKSKEQEFKAFEQSVRLSPLSHLITFPQYLTNLSIPG